MHFFAKTARLAAFDKRLIFLYLLFVVVIVCLSAIALLELWQVVLTIRMSTYWCSGLVITFSAASQKASVTL